MPVKEWTKSDKGFLYGIDISNQVYRSLGVKASHPTVDSSKRASKGIKTLVLYYEDSEWSPKLRLVA
jgi:hypothetical protein